MNKVDLVQVPGSLPEYMEAHRAYLVGRLVDIERRAKQEAEPYVKELARIEAYRPVRYMVLPK